ncbi:MAG: hypothetical protein NVSMB42_06680 [Herpetosiphon sp.]
MTKRRMGTVPHRIFWSPTVAERIEAYQAKHQIPSFSAAAEALVRIGLEQSPGEVLAPIIASTIRRELTLGMDRLVKLLLYDIVETGVAQRLAGAALLDIGRLKQDDPQRYEQIKQAAIKDTRLRLRRSAIGTSVAELYAEFANPSEPDQHGATVDGDHLK